MQNTFPNYTLFIYYVVRPGIMLSKGKVSFDSQSSNFIIFCHLYFAILYT